MTKTKTYLGALSLTFNPNLNPNLNPNENENLLFDALTC